MKFFDPPVPARPVVLTTRPITMPSPQYLFLTAFLCMLVATGGSSRADVQSLVFLRPVSVIVCAVACVTLRRDHLVGRRWLITWTGAICVLALLYLIAVPPIIWQSIPGRHAVIDVESVTDIKNIWRPLALVPLKSKNALLSLAVPLAVILLGIQLSRSELFRLLPVVVVLATLSGLVGILQVVGGSQSPFYLYHITNPGSVVGLFANRNHAATLLACLLPMLAVFACAAHGETNAGRPRQIVAAGIGVVLVPLILVTGSRSGLVSAIFGVGTAGLLYRTLADARKQRPNKQSPVKVLEILGGVGVVGIAFLTYILSRAEAIERVFEPTSGEITRADFLAESLGLFWMYFPVGSGPGSFAETYQIIQPSRLLDPTYLNHAHNDWVETLVNFGLPGVVILVAGIIAYCARSYSLWRTIRDNKRSLAFGRLASIIIALLAIASASDYPQRTPIMMGMLAICALWLNEAGLVRQSGRNVK